MREEDDVAAMEHKEDQNVTFQHQSPGQQQNKSEPKKVETFIRDGQKVGRNDPCPCGSGKKYKQCHGKLT